MSTTTEPEAPGGSTVAPSKGAPPAGSRFFYGWVIVAAGAGANAITSGFYLVGMGAYFLPVSETFNASKTAVSGVFAFARLESGVLGPFQGWLIDRFGSRPIMLFGITLMGAGFILLSQVPSLLWFYVVFILFIAIGQSFGLGPPVFATVINWFVRKRTKALGLVLSGSAIGGLFVAGIAWSVENNGWQDTSFYSGFTIWGLGLPLAMLMRYRPEPYGYQPDGAPAEAPGGTATRSPLLDEVSFTPKEALRTRQFWVMNVGFLLRMMGSSAVPVHLIAFLEEDAAFSTTQAALLLGLIGPVGLGGRLGFGFLGDAFTKRYVLFIAIVIQASSLVVLAFTDAMWQGFIFLALFATGHGGGAPVWLALRGEYFGRRHYATISGYGSVLILLGSVLGPLIAGIMSDQFDDGYSMAFVLMASLAMVGGIMIVLSPPPKPKQSVAKLGAA